MTGSEDNAERRFGREMRALRRARRMSQAALAQALAEVGGPVLNDSTVAKMENANRGIGLDEAVRIARILGSDVATMLGDNDAAGQLARAERELAEATEAAEAARARRDELAARIGTDLQRRLAEADDRKAREMAAYARLRDADDESPGFLARVRGDDRPYLARLRDGMAEADADDHDHDETGSGA